MENRDIMGKIDHTNLKASATAADIRQLCKEAAENQMASVCINASYVPLAAELLKGTGVAVCTVVGFPLGAMSKSSKIFEATEAVAHGASEIDMVINIGALKSDDLDYVLDEISSVKASIGENILKVIIETCLLTEEEKIEMCRIVSESGADYIKTSTGFSTGGATANDIALFSAYVDEGVKIKAAGGIKTKADMENFISLGAARLGTSSGIKILYGSTGEVY